MTIWVISDTHFSHANILTFRNPDGTLMRPFVSVEEMDETIIERWNKVVRTSDHVYHLGDVTMKRPALKQMERLNGHHRLVFGNHDIFDYKSYTEVGFEKLMGSRVLNNMLFTHIPVHPESLGRFRANVHGHIHSNNPEGLGERYVNVCVEVINYTPLTLEEIEGRMK